MNEILNLLNSPELYLISGVVISAVIIFALILFVKSYRAGVAIGIEKKKLLTSITASATFTILPSVSILLGVIALSGSLGIPLPWLRLSVVGALHYETSVADIAARSLGMSGLNINEMTTEAYVTIALVMSVGIIWGMVGAVLFLRKYLSILEKRSISNSERSEDSSEKNDKKSYGDIMMAAMFIGLICAYLGSYMGVFTSEYNYMPLLTVLFSAVAMAIVETLKNKFSLEWLENFALAGSMLVAMALIVFVEVIV